jgi:hypothetical protein
MNMFARLTLKRSLIAAASGLTLTGAFVGLQSYAADASESAAPTEPPISVRLSPSQYSQTVIDIFGSSINIAGRFEPETRADGLLAVGATKANVTDAGLERYDDLARGIAQQVVDPRRRAALIPCKPKVVTERDDACAKTFISSSGKLLYRRSLTDREIDTLVNVAGESTASSKDFYAGLSTSIATMLVSPKFLFRYKVLEADPERPGQKRLTGLSKASQLSFMLWNSGPDEALLTAAEKGELHTKEGLRRQVDRMVSSQRLEAGVRAFFADMLEFSDFETVAKDPMFFPRYTLKVKEESQEQTLRTVVDHLITRQGDYRELFTTPNTFLTRSLAALYKVPLIEKTDNAQPQKWLPYSYQPGDARAGILAQASFVALHSPGGRSSPTDRGKALRENILCQAVPAPPANVDFSKVETADPNLRTARERLSAHATEAMCSGCHKITDPIGFALENFDSSGSFRTTENGAVIDTTGELNGVKFDGPAGLFKTLQDSPAVTSCAARRAFAFGAGRMPAPRDADWRKIEDSFKANKYNFVTLLREIALSDLFYTVPLTQVAAK